MKRILMLSFLAACGADPVSYSTPARFSRETEGAAVLYQRP